MNVGKLPVTLRYSPAQERVVCSRARRFRLTRTDAVRMMLREAIAAYRASPGPPSPHPGRKGAAASVRLERALVRQVDELAGRWGRSRPETFRLLLWAVSGTVPAP